MCRRYTRFVVLEGVVLAIVVGVLWSGCADPAFQAYQSTPIFGKSRGIVRNGHAYQYQFRYRGGLVTYEGWRGGVWSMDGSRRPVGVAHAMEPGQAPPFPNGCLVYACMRAEEMRIGWQPGRRSQVIAYYRGDGSGHAFVVYDLPEGVFGEDNLGRKVRLPDWKNRTSSEALRLATAFCQQTKARRSSYPREASFIGMY
ncbi:hypothetical protein TSACC_2519 [Terrimicrobium sacchariphilum]|uniref:Uncharacterized protein n=1 Tax=Terrimicrobium sacchariphilum TaxID=690879 RepID=A0A146G3U8_TERSA|nr:hypothetical protein TSACC_2519 [Terrimicrobium sacchariphilum]